MTTIRAQVGADYSQFYVDLEDGGSVAPDADVGLAEMVEDGWLSLTAARQSGRIDVEVQVVDDPPEPDPAWDAVVEVGVRAGAHTCVRGWDPSDPGVEIPLTPGVGYRVRYVVVDGQAGSDQFNSRWGGDEPPAERYLIQLWPSASLPARVVVAAAPWAQYWTFGAAAGRLVADLADVPDPERLDTLIDRALDDHPDVAAHLRRGDLRFTVGIVRYVQRLFDVAGAVPAYQELRADYTALNGRIVERAATR